MIKHTTLKRFLILFYNQERDSSNLDQNKRFELFKRWGSYLSMFQNENILISGSPLMKQGYRLNKGGMEAINNTAILEGYMILNSANKNTLLKELSDLPIRDQKGMDIQVYEVDASQTIGR